MYDSTLVRACERPYCGFVRAFEGEIQCTPKPGKDQGTGVQSAMPAEWEINFIHTANDTDGAERSGNSRVRRVSEGKCGRDIAHGNCSKIMLF